MGWIITYIDIILFMYTALSVFYLFIFAIASKKRNSFFNKINNSCSYNRFAILIPAYKEDTVIKNSVQSFICQDYPSDYYDIIVISDKMREETNDYLAQLPIILYKVNFENSSKAKALKYAIGNLPENKYNTVVIIDADNTVEKKFLSQINEAWGIDTKAIQTHRKAKNLTTDTALLDALSEEINNSIFRTGHVNLGFSSALIGSGMAFDYIWFKENINKIHTAGEDKEIETLLLKQKIHINYLTDVYVYDEKVEKPEVFKHQRRRWLAAQLYSLKDMWKYFPTAWKEKNKDYCNKLLQMMLPPRAINLILIGTLIIITTLYNPITSIKWWALLLILIFALSISIPSYLVNKKLYKACRMFPYLSLVMLYNLFRLKGVNKNFIHTQHGKD